MSAANALRQRTLITPEGVDLRVRLASASERGAALAIDLAIIAAILIVLTLLALGAAFVMGSPSAIEPIAIIWLLGFFFLRNLYFAYFESGARGATPGKRSMRLRVAARDGGALSADRVFARNAMRELELFLPVSFLVVQANDIDAVLALLGLAWCSIFVFFPLFNRDRLRLGDIVAGSWVIETPRHVLLPDVAARTHDTLAVYDFTDAQLERYGVKELHVLEAVLRQMDTAAVTAVASRIRTKIGWEKGVRELDSEFLRAYYAALRGKLERKLLFGKRKRDKHDSSR